MELHSKSHSLSLLVLSLLYEWQSTETIGGKGRWKYEASFYRHLKKLDPGMSKVYHEPAAGQQSASERDPLPVACNIISDAGRSQSILTIKMIVVWSHVPS